MDNTWDKDLSDSMIAMNKIKDNYLPKLISGKIHSAESSDVEIVRLLDVVSGIDYIAENEHGLRGIATRVQWCDNPYNTFTIRSERHTGNGTELEKRLYQIENGYLYPSLTLQAYFDNRKENNLLSIGVIKTKDLYRIYQESPLLFRTNYSDNQFKFIHWDNLEGYVKKIILKKI